MKVSTLDFLAKSAKFQVIIQQITKGMINISREMLVGQLAYLPLSSYGVFMFISATDVAVV